MSSAKMWPWIGVLALAIGCSFDDSVASTTSDAGTMSDAAISIDADETPVYGFSMEYERWSVPESGTSGGFASFEAAGSSKYWFVVDMNLDGVLDLVQTQNPATTRVWTDDGQAYWAAFLGGSGGFADSATQWLVPANSVVRGFHARRWSAGSEQWDTIDLNGDGCGDLVRPLDPATGVVWDDAGSSMWTVHLCENGGFAAASTEWIVPDASFDRVLRCTTVLGCWGLRDLSGDGLVDLVHTAPAGSLRPWDAETSPSWRVYAAGSSGFAEAAQVFSVPSNEHAAGFFRMDSIQSGLYWQLVDLDGDGREDLVQTAPYVTNQPPTALTDGAQEVWKQFSAGANGFSVEPRLWALPLSAHNGGFYAVSRDDGVFRWVTIDINGDGHLDLIQTANSVAQVPSIWGSPSSDQWKVFFGDGAGFASSSAAWPVPDSSTNAGFYAVEASSGAEQWKLVDLDGDGKVELVQAADPTTGEVWNDAEGPHWRVFRLAQSP